MGSMRMRGIDKSFGGFKALDKVDFEARPGEVHALLGENGAGKSTLMSVACGLYAPDSGEIEVDGRPVQIDGARRAVELGIGIVHQHSRLVEAFTVRDNLALFNPGRPVDDVMRDAQAAARDLGFEIAPGRLAGQLGVADQQRLEILKVIVSGARLVILDEPTAILSDAEGAMLMELVRRLAQSGRAVVLVTHKLHEALAHSDRITVMRGGKRVAEALPQDMTPQTLTHLIVGANVAEAFIPSGAVGAPVLWLENVFAPGEGRQRGLAGASLSLKAGEIYGVAGVSGNGQAELAAVICGIGTPTQGRIMMADRGDITHQGPANRRRQGLAAIPADRYRHALAGSASVADNFAVPGALAGAYGPWAWFNRGIMRRQTRDAIARNDVQGVRSTGQPASLLSGGNAQKLVIAREFQGKPRVVLAHSPSRGLDVRAAAAVHDRLRQARDAGAAVIVISEDLDEILLLSDRIGVLNAGRIAAEFDAPADRAAIGAAMVHHEHA